MTLRPLHLRGFHPLAFIRKMDERERLLSVMQSGKWTVIAWNPQRTITSLADAVHAMQRTQKRPRRRDLPFYGGWIGWIGYDDTLRMQGVVSRHRQTSDAPGTCFHAYDDALLWDGTTLFALGNRMAHDAEAIHARPMRQHNIPTLHWREPWTKEAYHRAFDAVHDAIHEGEVYQLNLTGAFIAHGSVPSREYMARLFREHQPRAGSYIEYDGGAVVSCSPERFVRIDQGVLRTEPIKGTRPRCSTAQGDREARCALLADTKERAELSMIVDLLRNDVALVCRPGTVRVLRHRMVIGTPSVWQTMSMIKGRLRRGIRSLDALLAMLPCGSVTGCPKHAALQIIDRVERHARGLYCGVAVMLSACGRLESAVLIRTVLIHGRRLSLGTGGGIVWRSAWKREYAEQLHKASRIIDDMGQMIWIDGERYHGVPPAILDPSKNAGKGVFETLRTKQGDRHHLGAHLRRLRSSAALIGLPPPPDARTLRRMIEKAHASFPNAPSRTKIVWDGRRTIVACAPLIIDPADAYGIRTITVRCSRTCPMAKALPYDREWNAYLTALNRGAHEALLVTDDDRVVEGARSSLFWVKDGTLYTAKNGVLPGITRASILRLLRRQGFRISYATASYAELLKADEVFVTRATTGITPVTMIDGVPIGRGMPGKMTKKLQRLLVAAYTPIG